MWIRLLYKNVYGLAQHYLIENLEKPTETTETDNSREISDRERGLEFEMILGRNTNSIGRAFLGALLWPVASSLMGG